MSRLYGLEIEFFWGKDDRTPLVVCCYVKDSLEYEVLFFLSVGWTGLMCLPPIDPDIAVTKSTMKTSWGRSSLLRLDLWGGASLLGGFQVLLALKVRVPRAGGKVLVTSGAKYVD
jgi:hypothetical protein